jgi:hypothetical protein
MRLVGEGTESWSLTYRFLVAIGYLLPVICPAMPQRVAALDGAAFLPFDFGMKLAAAIHASLHGMTNLLPA